MALNKGDLYKFLEPSQSFFYRMILIQLLFSTRAEYVRKTLQLSHEIHSSRSFHGRLPSPLPHTPHRSYLGAPVPLHENVQPISRFSTRVESYTQVRISDTAKKAITPRSFRQLLKKTKKKKKKSSSST